MQPLVNVLLAPKSGEVFSIVVEIRHGLIDELRIGENRSKLPQNVYLYQNELRNEVLAIFI